MEDFVLSNGQKVRILKPTEMGLGGTYVSDVTFKLWRIPFSFSFKVDETPCWQKVMDWIRYNYQFATPEIAQLAFECAEIEAGDPIFIPFEDGDTVSLLGEGATSRPRHMAPRSDYHRRKNTPVTDAFLVCVR